MGEAIETYVPKDGVSLIPILAEAVPAFASEIIKILEEKEESWNKYESVEGIMTMIYNKQMQLWLGFDKIAIELVVLCSIERYSVSSVARIMWAGGENVDKFIPYLPLIEEWALYNGCNKMEVAGRTSWKKLLEPSGYKQSHIVLSKDIVKERGH